MSTLMKPVRPTQLVAQLLEQPGIVQAVQATPPEVLAKLVRHIGLEDAGTVVAMLTLEQLTEVFDDDLWTSVQPGDDETFDDERFALWLSVLLENGSEFAVRRVAELDEDLLTLGLSRQLFVIDLDALTARLADSGQSDEADLLDKQLDSCLVQEIDAYQLIARNHRTFETLREVLVALDVEHHDLLMRVLDRCCHISLEIIDDEGGLSEVLSAAETAAEDVAEAREARREEKGYVPPASARAFLRHAEVASLAELIADDAPDPITRAHFRVRAPASARPSAKQGTDDAAFAALQTTLREAGVLAAENRPALLAEGEPREGKVAAAMRQWRLDRPSAYAERLEELAYLSNVLLAARGLRPVDAARRALAVCERGARRLGIEEGHPADGLRGLSLVKLFRVGWHVRRAARKRARERAKAEGGIERTGGMR